jgi:hypothetical protein
MKSYRLDQYQIIECDDGKLTWKGPDLYRGSFLEIGNCYIEGDVLFFGKGEQGPPFDSKEFKSELASLPKWEKTKYFSKGPLYICASGRKSNR